MFHELPLMGLFIYMNALQLTVWYTQFIVNYNIILLTNWNKEYNSTTMITKQTLIEHYLLHVI